MGAVGARGDDLNPFDNSLVVMAPSRLAAPSSRTGVAAAVVGWRRGWRGWRLPQALTAVPAVLSGGLPRRRLQLPSSRASQDLKKGCSDKSRCCLSRSGPCRPDLKPRPIP